MQLHVYNGEHFERGPIWRGIASAVFLALVFLTLYGTKFLGGNLSWIPTWTDILSSLLLIAICIAYRWYVRKEIEKEIILEITPDALHIGNKVYQRHAVQGFSMENKRKDNSLYSIIFLVNHHHSIHTLLDTQENTIEFAHVLKQYTTFLEEIPLNSFEKFLRRIKV